MKVELPRRAHVPEDETAGDKVIDTPVVDNIPDVSAPPTTTDKADITTEEADDVDNISAVSEQVEHAEATPPQADKPKTTDQLPCDAHCDMTEELDGEADEMVSEAQSETQSANASINTNVAEDICAHVSEKDMRHITDWKRLRDEFRDAARCADVEHTLQWKNDSDRRLQKLWQLGEAYVYTPSEPTSFKQHTSEMASRLHEDAAAYVYDKCDPNTVRRAQFGHKHMHAARGEALDAMNNVVNTLISAPCQHNPATPGLNIKAVKPALSPMVNPASGTAAGGSLTPIGPPHALPSGYRGGPQDLPGQPENESTLISAGLLGDSERHTTCLESVSLVTQGKPCKDASGQGENPDGATQDGVEATPQVTGLCCRGGGEETAVEKAVKKAIWTALRTSIIEKTKGIHGRDITEKDITSSTVSESITMLQEQQELTEGQSEDNTTVDPSSTEPNEPEPVEDVSSIEDTHRMYHKKIREPVDTQNMYSERMQNQIEEIRAMKVKEAELGHDCKVVISHNFNGNVLAKLRCSQMRADIKEAGVDIILGQETHVSRKDEVQAAQEIKSELEAITGEPWEVHLASHEHKKQVPRAHP